MALFDGANAPTITVEFDPGATGIFTLGISTLGGTDVLGTAPASTWTTLPSTDVLAVHIRRGRTREDQAIQPGTCTVVLDDWNGDYDPDDTASPWRRGAYTLLTRGLPVRVSATWAGTTYRLFTGKAESVDAPPTMQPTTTITATDGLAWLGAQILATIASSYSGDTTTARVNRVLDAVGWPAAARVLSGSKQMQPTTYGTNALALCSQAEAAEAGRLYVDAEGNVVLIPAANLLTTPFAFTASDTRNPGTIEYDNIVTEPGAKYMVNTVNVTTTSSGIPQNASNAESVLRFGTWQKDYSIPLLNDADALTVARLYADRNALPATRVSRIEFSGGGLDSAAWASVLGADLGDNVNVERTTVDGRTRVWSSIIESMSIDLTPSSARFGADLSPSRRTGLFTLASSLLAGTDTLWY